MQIRNNFIVLFIAGSLISLVTFCLSKLTGYWMNGSPFEFNISQADVLYILLAGIAFAVFMKTVKIKSKEV